MQIHAKDDAHSSCHCHCPFYCRTSQLFHLHYPLHPSCLPVHPWDIHEMIRRFSFWACIILCIVFCKLFTTAMSLKKKELWIELISLDCHKQLNIFFDRYTSSLKDANKCTMVTAIWPNICKQCLLHQYWEMQDVSLTDTVSSCSSVQVPFFCGHCTTVVRNNWIEFALVTKNTYLSVFSFNFWHPPCSPID